MSLASTPTPSTGPSAAARNFRAFTTASKQCIIHFTDAGHAKKAGVTEIALDDPALVDLIGQKRRDNLADEIELLGAGPRVRPRRRAKRHALARVLRHVR